MYPELFRIGDFPIHTYGVLLAISMLAALFVAARLAARDDLPQQRMYDLGLWAIVGGLLGSKILLLLTDDGAQFFSLDFFRSGGVYFGGFLGGFLALLAAARFYKLPLVKVADAFAPGVALGQAIGRIGCFASGDSWGKPTSLPWGVHFTEQAHAATGVPVYAADGVTPLYLHPTQLYESFAMFAVFAFLFYLHRRKKFDGQVLFAYAIVYAIVRFAIEFFRGDERGDLFGLTTLTGLSTSQLISLIVAAGAVSFLLFRVRSKRNVKLLPSATALLLLAAVFAVEAKAQNRGDTPVRVETGLVNVFVSVTDKRGDPVRGLKPEQFEVFSDGLRQQFAHFSDEESPVAFGAVLDLRSLAPERKAAVLEALRRFTKELPANDDFFVLVFDARGSQLFDFVPTAEQIETQLATTLQREPNSLYDAVCLAVEKIGEKKRFKPALLLISDGADGGGVYSRPSRHDFGEMRKHLNEFDAQVYAVVFDKTDGEQVSLIDLVRQRKLRVNISRDATPLERAAIEDLTKTSGGMYHASPMRNSQEIYEALRHAASDARGQYAIGFYPPEGDGRSHEIKIRVIPTGKTRGERLFASYRRSFQRPVQGPEK